MKRIFPAAALTLLITLCAMPVFAQETTSAQDELISLVGKAIVEETTQRSEEVRKAKEVLDVVLKDGTVQEQEEARRRYDRADRDYKDSQKKLDTARLNAYADKCGKSPSEIQSMRDSGKGWGVIAKECGIHPSAAGKGKGKDKSKDKDDDEDDDKGKKGKDKKDKGKDKGKKK